MIIKVGIGDFMDLSVKLPVIDVRSPGEYKQGHIPGAFNIPLFDDNERSEVGKKYKEINKEAAFLTGLEFIGPKLVPFVKQAQKYARENQILIYCWRGGQRSANMAWLFSVAGIKSYVLTGGYKAYRQFLRNSFSEKGKIVILAGKTGSGKTEILNELKKLGEQVIDLEGFANHKGSAFGALGQDIQPTTEQFSNNLFNVWKDIDRNNTVWIEDESKNIGAVSIPDELYKNMRNAPLVIIERKKEERVKRLVKEYALFDPKQLEQSILKIEKRLGGLRTRSCIKSIQEKKFARAIEISLDYYDEAYLYGIKKRQNSTRIIFEVIDKPVNIIAQDIINLVKRKQNNMTS